MVLKKLPTIQTSVDKPSSTDSKNNESNWRETFEKFLSGTRIKETTNLRKNQQKKVCVEPGKSVAAKGDENNEEFDINQSSTSKCNVPKPTKVSANNPKAKYPNSQKISISGFSINDFVIVNLLYDLKSSKKENKKFYAQIIEINGDSEPNILTVKYLKQSVGYIYVFPLVQSIGFVSVDQIADVVYPEVLKRNRYKLPTLD